MKIDEQLSDDAFDAFLREETPYIDDAGFTAKVVQQLPPARRSSRSLRAIILLGVALLASAAAYTFSDGGRVVSERIAWLALMPPPVILLAAILVGILVTIFGAVGAISKIGEHNLR